MATTEELLKASTELAQESAEMIGGTFEQGVGFTPSAAEAGQDAFNSAVLSSANIEENVLPDLQEETEEFAKTGKFVDEGGTERFADGEPIEEKDDSDIFLENLAEFNRKFGRSPTDATGVNKTPGGGLDTTGVYDDEGNVIGATKVPTAAEEEESAIDKEQQDILDEMKAVLDANTKRQIDNIERQFALRKQQQAEINRRAEAAIAQGLLISGSSRYAQLSSVGIMRAKETAGLRAIAELDAQEQELISAALQAQAEGDFSILEEKLQMAKDKRAEKQAEAKKLNDLIIKQNEEFKKAQRTMDISSAILELNKGGITDAGDIFEQMSEVGFDATLEEIEKANKILNPTPEEIDALKGASTDYKTYKMMHEAGEIPENWDYFDYKDALANATRAPSPIEEPTLQPTVGFFDTKIETSIREDLNQLLGEELSKEEILQTLRRLYSPQEVSDEALKNLIGIVETPEEEIAPATEDVASSWLSDAVTFVGDYLKGGTKPEETETSEFGQGNFANTNIDDRIASLRKTLGKLATDKYLEKELLENGYTPEAIKKRTR